MSNQTMKKDSFDAIDYKQPSHRHYFKRGMQAGVPVAIGYIPIAIAFGLLAKASGIPDLVTILMSLIIFAGASQFIGVNLIMAGVMYWEIILTTFILNLRHFLMTASLSQRVSDTTSKKQLSLLSFGVTDETFSVASVQAEKDLPAMYLIGLNTIAFSAWNIGTWIGVFFAAGLPQSVQNSMGIALFAMFIGLLVPALKKSSSVVIVVFIAITISSLIYWTEMLQLSDGWRVILSTVIAASIGVAIFPEKEGESRD
ncbi:AzlC family ABC transporter permease [Salipaludibacillus agaradhaerens]|uniref:AzlC family ABC transporter permease n=1 Tax=Salipaludibacillus agaradhaerens TaxID=76935 RepID=UPI003B848EE1